MKYFHDGDLLFKINLIIAGFRLFSFFLILKENEIIINDNYGVKWPRNDIDLYFRKKIVGQKRHWIGC